MGAKEQGSVGSTRRSRRPSAEKPKTSRAAAPTTTKKSAPKKSGAKKSATPPRVATRPFSATPTEDPPRRELRRMPNPDAIELAEEVGRLRLSDCNVRKSFSRRADDTEAVPVLAQLVGKGAGRAAEPRVKVALTLLFLAREGDPWTVENVSGETWALLFGLDEPKTAGAARIGKAIRALTKEGIVRSHQERGAMPKLLVRHEAGSGKPWKSPVGERGIKGEPADFYMQLDRGFWANGWISVLSARAVTALVILLDATWKRHGHETIPVPGEDGKTTYAVTTWLPWQYLSEADLRKNYGISRDMFDRGVAELDQWQLIEKRVRPTHPKPTWARDRWFRELRVRVEVLRTPVVDIAAGKRVAKVQSGADLLSPDTPTATASAAAKKKARTGSVARKRTPPTSAVPAPRRKTRSKT